MRGIGTTETICEDRHNQNPDVAPLIRATLTIEQAKGPADLLGDGLPFALGKGLQQ